MLHTFLNISLHHTLKSSCLVLSINFVIIIIIIIDFFAFICLWQYFWYLLLLLKSHSNCHVKINVENISQALQVGRNLSIGNLSIDKHQQS